MSLICCRSYNEGSGFYRKNSERKSLRRDFHDVERGNRTRSPSEDECCREYWSRFSAWISKVLDRIHVFFCGDTDDEESSEHDEGGKAAMINRVPRGLRNPRNNCYFNSVMQPLCRTQALYFELQKTTENDLNETLTSSFISMYKKMRNGNTTPFSPKDVHNMLIAKVPRFRNDKQHDGHECLRHFLDEIRKEERSEKDPTTDSLTAVDKIFGGHLVTVYICKECNQHYLLFEPLLDISLPVFFEGEENLENEELIGTSSNKTYQTMLHMDHNNREYDGDKDRVMLAKDVRSGTPNFTLIDKTQENDYSQHSSKEDAQKKQVTYKNADSHQEHSKSEQINSQNKEENEQNRYKKAISKLAQPLSIASAVPSTDPKADKSTNKPPQISLTDCLKHFSRVEHINEEYLCEDCLREAMARGEADEDNLKLTSATKQTLIFNPPAILTIHFKRFELLPGRSRKRSDMVRYPEYLDIAPYCSSQCLRNDPPRKNIWYSLYAVVVHSGSLQSGHYTAYVKVIEGEENIEKLTKFLQHKYFNHNVTSAELIKMIKKENLEKKTVTGRPEREEASKWYLMNDESVREVLRKEVLTREAYLLFYERVEGREMTTAKESVDPEMSGNTEDCDGKDMVTEAESADCELGGKRKHGDGETSIQNKKISDHRKTSGRKSRKEFKP